MHELAIACELVDIAEAAARTASAARVAVVTVRLGALSGVVPEALLFGYDTATRGTLLEGSRLDMETVPVVVACTTCGQQNQLERVQDMRCPACGSPETTLVQGKEIELSTMEIVEHEHATA